MERDWWFDVGKMKSFPIENSSVPGNDDNWILFIVASIAKNMN